MYSPTHQVRGALKTTTELYEFTDSMPGDVVKFVVNQRSGRMNIFINGKRVGKSSFPLTDGVYHPFVEMNFAGGEVAVIQGEGESDLPEHDVQ